MPQLRTLIDSGVLLAAFKAVGELAENALAVLGDAERQFVSSDFVRLELLPKPICYGNDAERLFYETFFANVEPLVQASALLVEAAEREAEAVGLSAMDALHICDDAVPRLPGSPRPFAPALASLRPATHGTAYLLAVRSGGRKTKTGPSACPRRPAADQKTNSPRQTSCALQSRPTSRPCHPAGPRPSAWSSREPAGASKDADSVILDAVAIAPDEPA